MTTDAPASNPAAPWWQRLHWQVFTTHLVVVALVVGSLSVVFYAVLTRAIDQVVAQELEASTALVVRFIADAPDDASALAPVPGDAALRVTIIAEDGDVLADSSADPSTMDNHGERYEVVTALAEGTGWQRRVSSTLGEEFVYYGQRIDRPDGPVVVRVALRYDEIRPRLSGLRGALALAVLLALLIGGTLSFVVARRATAPLARLGDVTSRIGAGHFDVQMPARPRGELGTMWDSIAGLRGRLDRQFRQLDEEKALLLTILGAMSEGVIVVDATGRVLLANPMALHLLGVDERWTPDDVDGRLLLEVTRNPRLNDLVEAAVRTGESGSDEFESRRGAHRILAASVAPLREDDAVRGAVAAFFDLTRIRRLERVRKDFVANVSHELRTPVAAIRGWAETLTSGVVELPDLVEEHLLTILRQSERLGALVDDLLILARLESTGLETAFVEIELAERIDDMTAALGESIDDERLQIVVDIADGLERVRSVPRALEYVVRNLLENAVKYTADGGEVRITVREDDGTLVIDVTDTGVGIEGKHLPRIFERFYRVDKGRSRDVGGTGLGLSIVKHYVSSLGGQIDVTSEVGVGSTFVVTLPEGAWDHAAPR